MRKKKAGRKKKREPQDLILKYLNREIVSPYTLAKKRGTSQRRLRLRLRRSLHLFLKKTPWPAIPEKPLIAIADVMISNINQMTYSWYFILLRKIDSNEAAICKPYLKRGPELASGWRQAFQKLPASIKGSIVALVCDGHRGLISVANQHHWLIQRCHFHLLAAIQGRRSRWIRSRHQALGQFIYELAVSVLTSDNELTIQSSLEELKDIATHTSSPALRKILSGFTRYYQDYRTYLKYPKLNLPTTSNAVESLVGSIRDLLYRARGFRTLPAMCAWIEALLKHKQKITCNGNSPTKFRS